MFHLLFVVQMTNHSTSSQEDWLEKQIESEKCISNLEDRVKSLKVCMIKVLLSVAHMHSKQMPPFEQGWIHCIGILKS